MKGRNYRAVVEYDGTQYSGFQIQPGRPTIQGELERALKHITQAFVRVNGAGRTDAGVHARGQVINFRTSWSHGVAALQRAMNAVLPPDVAVRDVSEASEDFHARYSAWSRAYIYSVHRGVVRAPLLERFAHHARKQLDLRAMNSAAAQLVGEHDFAAFGHPTVGESTVRVVHRAIWRSALAVEGPGCSNDGEGLLRFVIEANGFLRGMVRRIVGTLLAVGEGEISIEDFAEILSSQDIRRASPPVPAHGLCLWRVDYDAHDLAESRDER